MNSEDRSLGSQTAGSGKHERSVSTTLLQLVRTNDPVGWDRLVRLFTPLVYQWCRTKGLSPQSASDVSQEVFVSVSKGIKSFKREADNDSFRGWMWTITINKIRDQYRKSERQPKPVGGSDFQHLVSEIEFEPHRSEEERVNDTNILLRSALELIQNEFEPRSIEIFMKSVLEDKTAPLISEELGVSVAAVYKAKSRVMRRLREELGELMT